MEKIRHDSSYEWLSGESWKEWSASFFSMGWKIWGVVLITELFLFLFFKPTADCGRLRYGWLFIVRPSGLQLLLLFVYRLLTGRQKRVYSRRAMAGCAIFLLTSYAAVMAWVHTSVTLMPMVLLLPMLLTPLYKPGHDACAGGTARCSLCAGLCLFYTCQFLFLADNPVY